MVYTRQDIEAAVEIVKAMNLPEREDMRSVWETNTIGNDALRASFMPIATSEAVVDFVEGCKEPKIYPVISLSASSLKGLLAFAEKVEAELEEKRKSRGPKGWRRSMNGWDCGQFMVRDDMVPHVPALSDWLSSKHDDWIKHFHNAARLLGYKVASGGSICDGVDGLLHPGNDLAWLILPLQIEDARKALNAYDSIHKACETPPAPWHAISDRPTYGIGFGCLGLFDKDNAEHRAALADLAAWIRESG